MYEDDYLPGYRFTTPNSVYRELPRVNLKAGCSALIEDWMTCYGVVRLAHFFIQILTGESQSGKTRLLSMR